MDRFKLELYNNPVDFFNQFKYEEGNIYIVTTSSLSMHLKDLSKSHKNKIWTFDNLFNALFEDYANPLNKVKLKALVREKVEVSCNENNIKERILKDLDNIYTTFNYYLTSGIFYIDETLGRDSISNYVRKAYNLWIESDLVQKLYLSKINFSKNNIKRLLNQYYIKKWSNKNSDTSLEGIRSINKLIFINFTYLDAPRFYLLKKFANADIDIVFQVPNDGYNKPWKRNYSFIKTENITRLHTDSDCQTNSYIEYLKGNIYHDNKNNIFFKEYQDIVEFKDLLTKKPIFQSNKHLIKWLKNNGEDTSTLDPNCKNFKYEREYLTFSKEKYNTIFNGTILNYFDKYDSYLNFLEGKFLNGIYQMKWNNDGTDILLKYSCYCECITSGWIETRRGGLFNGKGCFDILIDLEPYMDNVKSVKDIFERLEKLLYFQQFSSTFDELAKDKTNGNIVKEYLQNPLKVFPYVEGARHSATIRQLIELTKKLQSAFADLVPKSNLVNLKDHTSALLSLWHSINEKSILIDEYKLLKKNMKKTDSMEDKKRFSEFANLHRKDIKFIQRLEQINKNEEGNITLSLSEMKEYMIICSKYNKSNVEDEYDNGFNLIKVFNQIDGIMINGTKELYITDLSEKSLSKYVSSLSFKIYDDISLLEKDFNYVNNLYTETEIQLILNQINITKQLEIGFVKYYIGSAINSAKGKIEFSYIKNINENDQESSVYKILKTLYGQDVKEESYKDLEELIYENYLNSALYKNNINPSFGLYNYNKLNEIETNIQMQQEISPIGWLDLDFCPRKFYYNNILGFYPVYLDDFQQRMAFSIVGKLLKSQLLSSDNVEDYFYYLFSQWNTTTKDNMIATNFKQDIRNDYKFQNVRFPYDMKGLQLLRSPRSINTRTKRYNAYKEREDHSEKYFKEFIKEELYYMDVNYIKGRHCIMCPYKMICVEGEFPVDRNEY
ncbi:MAG: hypothetical protein AB7V16_08250 [Vulcanibacillus sp.]